MQKSQPTVLQLAASDCYRRAVGCIMGNGDPLRDMSTNDKYQVLGIIAELRQNAGDRPRQLAILDEVFARRADHRRRFLEVIKKHKEVFFDVAEKDREEFFTGLRTEFMHMWDLKIADEDRIKRETIMANIATARLQARAAVEPKTDDGPSGTVSGWHGVK